MASSSASPPPGPLQPQPSALRRRGRAIDEEIDDLRAKRKMLSDMDAMEIMASIDERFSAASAAGGGDGTVVATRSDLMQLVQEGCKSTNPALTLELKNGTKLRRYVRGSGTRRWTVDIVSYPPALYAAARPVSDFPKFFPEILTDGKNDGDFTCDWAEDSAFIAQTIERLKEGGEQFVEHLPQTVGSPGASWNREAMERIVRFRIANPTDTRDAIAKKLDDLRRAVLPECDGNPLAEAIVQSGVFGGWCETPISVQRAVVWRRMPAVDSPSTRGSQPTV